MIDNTGKILYKNENDGVGKPFSGGISIFTPRRGDNQILLNSEGTVVGSTESGTFDMILAYGDGLAFVYKNASDITSEKHMYGVLDKDGNWIVPLWEDSQAVANAGWSYWGSSIFFSSREGVMFNSRNGKSARFDYSVTRSLCPYINDKAFFCGTYNGITGTFFINTDLEINEVCKDRTYEYASNGILIYSDKENIELFDTISNTFTVIDQYTKEQITGIEFYDKYGIMKIRGMDKQDYFTLIDRQGTEIFYPILGFNPIYSDERIIYKNFDSTGYIMVDIDRKEISRISSVEDFSDGIITNYLNYYDKNGQVILEALTE